MIDYDLWARIDRVLHECDARQLPPLTAAIDPAVTEPAPRRPARFRWPWRRT